MKNISATQFSIFRIIFGAYLSWHFLAPAPYAAEIYSNIGLLPSADLNPTFWLFPSIFWISDSPLVVTATVCLLAAASLCLVLGFYRRPSALLIWYGWACLFNRNVLSSNPSLSYVGVLLLLCAILPAGEPFSLKPSNVNERWRFPKGAYWCAWWLMAIGYSFSGLIKLQSPSWVDGTAFHHLITNPLARPSFLRDFLLTQPESIFAFLTWGALVGEIIFAPLSFHRIGRSIAWTVMVGMHLGILLFVDFADLTMGMLMLHIFTFDPEWLPGRKTGKRVVFFDGDCGLCQKSIQVFFDLDQEQVLRFAPLQGETASENLPPEYRREENLQTMVYLVEAGESKTIRQKSDAVLHLLSDAGGFGRILSLSRIVPLGIRNQVYDFIANRRKAISSKLVCRMPDEDERARLLP